MPLPGPVLYMPLFDDIEVSFESGDRDPIRRQVAEQEDLHIDFRDDDLHLMISNFHDASKTDGTSKIGNAFSLSVMHTKIRTLNEDRLVFEGFATPEIDARLPWARCTVVLRKRRHP